MANEALASLEQLLAGTPRRYKVVKLPVSGLTVRIQSLTEKEMAEYQASALSRSGGAGALIRSRIMDAGRRLICLCLVDAEGRRVLNETHVESLSKWDSADSSFLYDECSAHCGINRKDIEDLEKNSEKITVEG